MGEAGRPISVERVAKWYSSPKGPIHALDAISFGVRAGEFVSLLGPSGCGKSTLLLIIAGLVRASTGRVAIDSEPVTGAYTDLGIVFQRPVLLDWRTVLDNVLVQMQLRGRPRAPYRHAAMRLLEQVGLHGFEQRHPYELSGGMQQRVALCRALIHDPPLLLMDEPFGALDALTRDQLSLDLQHLWENTRKTVVFVTHSIQEAVFLSDKIVIMTPRPGTVDEIMEVALPRPRTLASRELAEFIDYTRKVKEVFLRRGVLHDAV